MDTFTLEQLDFSEIQRAMDEILNQSFSFRDTVLSLLSGEQPFTLESFFRTALTEAGVLSHCILVWECNEHKQ